MVGITNLDVASWFGGDRIKSFQPRVNLCSGSAILILTLILDDHFRCSTLLCLQHVGFVAFGLAFFFFFFFHILFIVFFHQAEELCQLLRENMAADPRGHKIIVFFTTARLTQFYAELCNLMVSQPVTHDACTGWVLARKGGNAAGTLYLRQLDCSTNNDDYFRAAVAVFVWNDWSEQTNFTLLFFLKHFFFYTGYILE